ncbi:hypothetical protein P154DRAFT_577239 [Amniculicola lignicola CBS 123094]|uniref:Uncharacterized protein n=1 Tax=Amniculicola lignicola CBS 123094 TaxID=1392246 RepID=A0A6A5WNA5_9PLEO|nr:hypothetical protein P154DRAFT_577239 [Amniculicola lignicola CBS 123094]
MAHLCQTSAIEHPMYDNLNFRPPPIWPAVYPPVHPIPIGYTPTYTVVRRDITPFPTGPPPVTYIPPSHASPGLFSNLGTYPFLREAEAAAHNALVDLALYYESMGYTGFIAPHVGLDTRATVTYELKDGGEMLIAEFEITEGKAPVWGHAGFEYLGHRTEIDIGQYTRERSLFFPPLMGPPSMIFPALSMPAGIKAAVNLPAKDRDMRSVGVWGNESGQGTGWMKEKNPDWAATETSFFRKRDDGPFRGLYDRPYDATMRPTMPGWRRLDVNVVIEQPDELAECADEERGGLIDDQVCRLKRRENDKG